MIEQIKEALEKATPGPWVANENKILQDKYDRDDYRVLLCNVYRGTNWEADSNLIANAPTWLKHLLDELEKAQKVIDAKFVFWNDGQNEERYVEQEKMIQLEKEHTAMKKGIDKITAFVNTAFIHGEDIDLNILMGKLNNLSTLTKEAPNE